MSEQDALLSAVRQGVSQVLREQHEAIRQTLAGLDTAALNWSPGPEMNSIAVIFTHMLGAEDAITATVLGEPIERDRDAEFRPELGRCYYADCTHLDEPGCAVREAVEAGAIDRGRYESYRALRNPAEAED